MYIGVQCLDKGWAPGKKNITAVMDNPRQGP